MEIRFRNNYPATVSVAVMFYSPGTCGQHGNWGTRGWWNIAPGQMTHVLNTDNRFMCYYAEAGDGARWVGNFGPMYVYRNSFDSCLHLGSTAAIGCVGTRQVDTGGKNTIVNLNP